MNEAHLYQKIAEEVRQEILQGRLKPGDRLPSLRQMTERWGCTTGTVQHAYQELARQGLVSSRAGQGTHVIKSPPPSGEAALRRASLVHRSEAFLLESLTAGYTPSEIEAALQQALERWQVVARQPASAAPQTLRFAGSHDPAFGWLAAHFPDIVPTFTMLVDFTGSLGGLIALVEGQADLAGCHLWDEETDAYNAPFVRRLLPGKKMALLTLAHRRLGLIVAPGNPAGIHNLVDLQRSGLRFINRQSGSGTRVWLDAALRKAGISGANFLGYEDERMTHSEVAAAVAGNQADAGFGLETAALAYGLEFIYLVRERYDLVIPAPNLALPSIARLAEWLAGQVARQAISSFGGYDVEETGQLRWAS